MHFQAAFTCSIERHGSPFNIRLLEIFHEDLLFSVRGMRGNVQRSGRAAFHLRLLCLASVQPFVLLPVSLS